MPDLILRPSTLFPGRPWALQIRSHASYGPTDYFTLCHLTEETARAIDGEKVFFLFGHPDEKKDSPDA